MAPLVTVFRLSFFSSFLSVASIQVVDVGAPRTGTQSMHMAMQILGYKALHTGYRWDLRIPLCDYLFNNGTLEAALESLDGWDAAMDEPMALLYEEIMENFPESKFILTISDPDSWHDSYVELSQNMDSSPLAVTVLKYATSVGMAEADLTISPESKKAMSKCTSMRSWGCDFRNPTTDTRRICLENYKKHNARVQQVIPPHRLLVYNWSDGWTGLAHFLQKQIPEGEFPHEDKAADMWVPGHAEELAELKSAE
mmetsp:Transcript_28111/g.66753  ORF Transcript_28111/g.66753 Transcript_28111/m.66753 type:complete len:254 (+) Transcript_28111:44-805(+)